MCGIVGYTGAKGAVEPVLRGLEQLEYRGYDSAGIAALENGRLEIVRAVGRIAELRAKLSGRVLTATCAIGHTRWATHGKPTEANAHPHVGGDGLIAVVHNGIIENYEELRHELEAQGARFLSQTDTEAAAHLIAKLYAGDLTAAVEAALKRIRGTFAFAVVSPKHPGLIVGARRGSPLAVGIADGAMMLASDAIPLLPHTKRVAYLEEDEVATLLPGSFTLTRGGKRVEPRIQELAWSPEQAERGGFPHFMLKEIHEQPVSLHRLASKLVADPGNANSFPTFALAELKLSPERLKACNRIVILGQGTALHAGMIGRNMLERCARLPVTAEYGSDFRYRDPVVDEHTLVMCVSQSGETADTIGGVREAKARGCPTIGILNAAGSTLARECDGSIFIHAGPEIGVASTKAFTGQIAALYGFALHLGMLRGTLSAPDARRRAQDLIQVPLRVEEVLQIAPQVEALARKYAQAEHALYLGRGTGFPLALEGALKLKEISYIHAEGLDAAEMKHGPIALIDERMPVVVLALKGRRYEKILSNIQEVKARGGRVIAIASHDDHAIRMHVDDVLPVPDDRGIMNSAVCAVPLQLLAYYMAVARGRDVDKPRNLAKSVTVE